MHLLPEPEMGRFQRAPNQLYKADIIARLRAAVPDVRLDPNINLMELLERAVALELMTDAEVKASLPKRNYTVKAYLGTFVKDAVVVDNIDKYVVASSLMWSYGTKLLNLAAIDVLGSYLGPIGPLESFDGVVAPETREFFALLKRDTYKHAFMPDAWADNGGSRCDESSSSDSDSDDDDCDDSDDDDDGNHAGALDPTIRDYRQRFGRHVAHLVPPDRNAAFGGRNGKWKSNIVNDMKMTYDVNVDNHVKVHLRARIAAYFDALLPGELEMMQRVLDNPLRPTIMSQDAYEVASNVRHVFVPPRMFVSCVPADIDVTAEVFNLHAFLARQPDIALRTEKPYHLFSYLPVAGLERRHAYVDASIAHFLVPKQAKKAIVAAELGAWTAARDAWEDANPSPIDEKRFKALQRQAKKPNATPHPDLARYVEWRKAKKEAAKAFAKANKKPRVADLSLGRLLGVDSKAFVDAKRHVRKELRRRLRKKLRSAACKRPGSAARKLRTKYRAAMKRGHGALPRDGPGKFKECTSLKTDGVAVEFAFETPSVDVDEFIARCSELRLVITDRLVRGVRNPLPKAHGPEEWQRDFPNPEFASEDRGRAKLSTSVGAPNGYTKPETRIVFTRNAYYHDIWHKKRTDAEQERRKRLGLAAVYDALGAGGGIKNTSGDSWRAYLDVERVNAARLIDAHVNSKFHAQDNMLGYRLSRSSKDTFAHKLVTQGDMSRPLVLGTGSVKFACTGKGEMAVPTCALEAAVARMVRRMAGRRKILRLMIDEFRTTLCEPETLEPTVGKRVNFWKVDGFGNRLVSGARESRRLRVCKSNTHAPGRDRDIMAARNILLLTIYKFYGIARPWPLSRTTSNADLVAWALQL